MKEKSKTASFGLQRIFSYVTIILNFMTVALDYTYLYNVLTQPIRGRDKVMAELNPYVWSGLIIATIQLLMAIYIAAYHSVHMKA